MREKEQRIRPYAKKLKREMTEAEKLLWAKLRNKQLNGVKFHRQKVIGHYIADFLSFEKMLIIEIDGGQHSFQEKYDNQRTQYLEKQGFTVIRFWNNDVLQRTDDVLNMLWELTE